LRTYSTVFAFFEVKTRRFDAERRRGIVIPDRKEAESATAGDSLQISPLYYYINARSPGDAAGTSLIISN
jgi:hypothetical protein